MSDPDSGLPSSVFRHDPELVAAFVEGRLDESGQAELAELVARLLPFHYQLSNAVAGDLVRVTTTLGGYEQLLCWLDGHPGLPRLVARLYRVIAVLDHYSANPGVVRALAELRSLDPYPRGLAGHLVPDTTTSTLAGLSQEIESLVADDRPDEAGYLALQALRMLGEIAQRAARLDRGADRLDAEVEALERELRPVVPLRG